MIKKTYVTPEADLISLFDDIRTDKLPDSMNGVVIGPNGDIIGGIDICNDEAPDCSLQIEID